MDHPSNDRKSVLMFITAVLIFGTVGIFRRFIPFSSAFLAFSRGILGGLFLLLYMKLKGKTCAKLPWPVLGRLALTGAVMGLNWILLFEAYNETSVQVATLCYYMEPVIVILASSVLFKEKLTRRKAICSALAFLGMVLVSGVLESGGVRGGEMKGILLGLLAALLYSCVVLMNKRAAGIDPFEKTVIELAASALVMVPYLALTEDFSAITWSASAIALLSVAGIVHTGIAYALYFGSIDRLKAQTIALLSYIDPITALILSALILHESLSIIGIAGAVLILGSAVAGEME